MENNKSINSKALIDKVVWASLIGIFLFVWRTNSDLTRMKDDLKYYKIIYDKHEALDKEKRKETAVRIEEIRLKDYELRDIMQNNMTLLKKEIGDMKSDLSLIKHQLRIIDKK